MAHLHFNQSGLEIVPDGPFYADLLYDYLHATTYRWRCTPQWTYFLIDDFEYSEDELLLKLGEELKEQNIEVEFYLSE